MKAEYIETIISEEEMEGRSEVKYGDGGVEYFGSAIVAEGEEVKNEGKSDRELNRELNRGQMAKRGNMMAWATEFLAQRKQEKAQAKKRGSRLAWAAAYLGEARQKDLIAKQMEELDMKEAA